MMFHRFWHKQAFAKPLISKAWNMQFLNIGEKKFNMRLSLLDK